MKSDIFVLILCGGKSLRLWPLSKYRSKNFLDILGFLPLEITIKRFLKIVPRDNIFLVSRKQEKRLLERIKLINKKNIFFEPESKNTAAAILFSLQFFIDFPQNILIISPADHLIKREKNFFSSLKKAVKVAREGYVCTLGIKPDKPTSDFGYIKIKERVCKNVYLVKKFIEKPNVKKAKRLIQERGVFYNSGIFISSVETLFEEYKRHYPFYNDFIHSFRKKKINYFYKKIENIPFDKAIMEKSKKICVIEADFFWKDFGNWLAIYDTLPKDKNGNVKRANVQFYKGKDNFVYSDNLKKKILAMGIKDIFFIDTEDFTLVATSKSLGEIKKALNIIK
jgi:mannose-1-phosphate guanylyltransferase/mannose-6-phosphate isomerase